MIGSSRAPIGRGGRALPATRGRHTLGSAHDSPHPAEQAEAPPAAGLPAGPEEPQGARPVWWRAARERAKEAGGEEGRILRRLLDHVDSAWTGVAELQLVCAQRAGWARRPHADPRVAHLFAFIEAEMMGTLRRCALDTAALVPGVNPQGDTQRAALFDAMAERLERALSMVHLASADPAVPADVREAVRTVALGLSDWSPEFSALANAAAVASGHGEAGR